jgi:hypothetical protein
MLSSGDNVYFGIRTKLVVYPDNIFALWLSIGVRFFKLVWLIMLYFLLSFILSICITNHKFSLFRAKNNKLLWLMQITESFINDIIIFACCSSKTLITWQYQNPLMNFILLLALLPFFIKTYLLSNTLSQNLLQPILWKFIIDNS